MSDHLDRALGVTLTLAALVMVATLVKREFFPAPPLAAPERDRDPTYVDNWQQAVSDGRVVLGTADAPVTVLEFGDFQCPYCRRFSTEIQVLYEQFGGRFSLVFLHYPLTRIHRFAMPAARAAECSADQGRFKEFHDLLFEKQDSLGLKTWSSYAEDVGVPDTVAFAACVDKTQPILEVQNGLELVRNWGVTGTPTVMINGWLYPSGLHGEDLESALRDAFEGAGVSLLGSDVR